MNRHEDDRALWLTAFAIGTFSLWYAATKRSQNPLWLILAGLCLFPLAYHCYGRFVSDRVAKARDAGEEGGTSPATFVWTLGYHFAAIAGAGALIAPVAIVQYGFLPGLLCVLLGTSLAGAVHDFMALLVSIKRGRSLPQMGRSELGPVAALALTLLLVITLVAVLSAVATALAWLVAGNAGVTYALALTVPIALLVSFYARVLRPGRGGEALTLGLVLFALAVVAGTRVASTGFVELFLLSERSAVVLLAAYCLITALIPIDALSLVRGALSGYLVLGAVGLMAVAVAFAAPSLQVPPTTNFVRGDAPLLTGGIFPAVAIALAAGAVSGYHALIASGPTARLVRRQSRALPIGFGGMLLTGFVALLTFTVTATLSPADLVALGTGLPPERVAEIVGALPSEYQQLGLVAEARLEELAVLATGAVRVLRALPKVKPTWLPRLYQAVNVLAALLLFAALEAGVYAGRLLVRGGLSGSVGRQQRSGWLPLVVIVVWALLSLGVFPRFTDPLIAVSSLLLAAGVLALGTVLVVRLHRGRARLLALVTAIPALAVLLVGLAGGILGIRELWPRMSTQGAFRVAYLELPKLALQRDLIPLERAWSIVREMPLDQAAEAFASGGRDGLAGALSARFGELVPQEGTRLARLVVGRARAVAWWSGLQVAGLILAMISALVLAGVVARNWAAGGGAQLELPVEMEGEEPVAPESPPVPSVLREHLARWLTPPPEEMAAPPERPQPGPVAHEPSAAAMPRPSRSVPALRTALLVASIALSIYGSRVLYRDRGDLAVVALFYALALVCLRLALGEGWPPAWTVGPSPRAWWDRLWAHRWELLGLSLIFGIAVFFRVHRFGYFPPANEVAFEEAQAGGDAFKVLRLGHRPIEFPLTAYLPALSFALLGESTTALRLPFLTLGCLTVLPFYWFLRELVDVRVALFGTCLLAVSRWHAVVSRIADELFAPIFVEVLILYLVVRGSKTRGVKHFFWLGILSAYMLYAYTGYRVIPFLVLLLFIGKFFRVIISRTRGGYGFRDALRVVIKLNWQPALAFMVAFGIVATPLCIATLQGDRFFTEGFARASASGGQTIGASFLTREGLNRLRSALLIFTHKGASYPALNIPGEPMLDPVSGVLFVLGATYSLLTLFRPYRLWFLLWMGAVMLVGAVFPPNLYVGRFSNLIPIVFVFISFLVGDLSDWVGRRRGSNGCRLLAAALAVVAIVALVLNFRTLFERQVSHPQVRRAYQDRVVALCSYVASLPSEPYVYIWDRDQLLEYVFVSSDYSWACHRLRGEAVSNMESVLPATVRADQIAYIFVNPVRPVAELTWLIGQFYPQIQQPSAIIDGEEGAYRIVVYLVHL